MPEIRRTKPAFAALCGLCAVLFAYAVVVQHNDPDPFAWMAMYGAAAVLSAISVRVVLASWMPALVAAIASVWALLLVPSVIRQLPSFLDTFGTIQMMAPGVEETREALGLAIVAIWMAVLAIVNRRRPARKT